MTRALSPDRNPHGQLMSGCRVVVGVLRARGQLADMELAGFLDALVARSAMHLAGFGPPDRPEAEEPAPPPGGA